MSSVAVAAAAVDPFPADPDLVAPLTGGGGGSGGAVGVRTSSKTAAEAIATVGNRATSGSAPAAAASSQPASAAPGAKRKSGSKATPSRARTSAVEKTGRYGRGSRSSSSGSSSRGSSTRPKPTKQKYGDLSTKHAKALRTGGRSFFIVCDAESITFPELVESIDILDELGTRDVGAIYADWEKAPVRG